MRIDEYDAMMFAQSQSIACEQATMLQMIDLLHERINTILETHAEHERDNIVIRRFIVMYDQLCEMFTTLDPTTTPVIDDDALYDDATFRDLLFKHANDDQ
jgi:hypothetical protein